MIFAFIPSTFTSLVALICIAPFAFKFILFPSKEISLLHFIFKAPFVKDILSPPLEISILSSLSEIVTLHSPGVWRVIILSFSLKDISIFVFVHIFFISFFVSTVTDGVFLELYRLPSIIGERGSDSINPTTTSSFSSGKKIIPPSLEA